MFEFFSRALVSIVYFIRVCFCPRLLRLRSVFCFHLLFYFGVLRVCDIYRHVLTVQRCVGDNQRVVHFEQLQNI